MDKQKLHELIGPSWIPFLEREFEKTYMKKLGHYVAKERRAGTKIYPEKGNVFNAFKQTPYSKAKVCIIGQDPYYNGLADGLAFSSQGETVPKSLRNIFKEIENSTGELPHYNDPNLKRWATQGVFLLNKVLTVEHGLPNSHANKGWEKFTARTVRWLSKSPVPVVFMLWGSKAKEYKQYIESQDHHLILTAYHPSPRSASRGFFGCNHFSKCNNFLKKHNIQPIDWK